MSEDATGAGDGTHSPRQIARIAASNGSPTTDTSNTPSSTGTSMSQPEEPPHSSNTTGTGSESSPTSTEHGTKPDDETVLELLVAELYHRLKTEPDKIPAHTLGTLMAKLAPKGSQEPEQVGPPVGLLDSIGQTALPDERKAELVRAEIKRFEEQIVRAEGILSGLEP